MGGDAPSGGSEGAYGTQGLTQCPPPSVHSALNVTDSCALCVCYRYGKA